VDFIVNNYRARAHYLVNRAARGHWLQIRLRGRKSNRDGIGAAIRVRTGSRRQVRIISAGEGYASQYSRVAHFGLGDGARVDEIDVSWPGGTRQVFRSVEADRLIEIDEGAPEIRVLRPAPEAHDRTGAGGR
jgi:hypothetical protein